jgi:hypothetical protein
MAGIHVAEKLREHHPSMFLFCVLYSPARPFYSFFFVSAEIPFFHTFTMPWTRTRAYPHPFAVPDKRLGGKSDHSFSVVNQLALICFFLLSRNKLKEP